ncbi:MAG TPA: hypothetical protein VK658_04550 [Chryseolinea sp.]|nr:hypothetical protein [Chryseolinea sp.]
MELVFSDSPEIDELTFKRLLLLADKLVFVDRPSIMLADNFFTVGMPSGLSTLIDEFKGTPVELVVDEPPNSTFNSDFYKKYFEIDLKTPDFLDTIFDGIQNNWIYDHHFDPKSNSATGEFKDFKNWILINRNEIKNSDLINYQRPDQLFKITSSEEAMFAFRILAAEQSLRVTSVIEVSNRHTSNPTSINPYLNRLILARLNNEAYIGKPMKSRQLGLKLLDCIVPDEALLQINWLDILSFRNLAKDYFQAWSIELRKIEATLFSNVDTITNQDIMTLVDSDINPRLQELKTEITKIRDERFKIS